MSSDYMILDYLLFHIVKDLVTEDYKPLLCIPTSKVDTLLYHFHSSLMGDHTGVTKAYMTISQHIYCPNLAHHICAYITGCHICQMIKAGKKYDQPFNK